MLGTTLWSCGESKKTDSNLEVSSENITTETSEKNLKRKSNNTFLCKINGENWEYTNGDGLVSTNSSTKVRTATITFKKKLEKGSESVQLEYDVNKNSLTTVRVQLKRPSKEGKTITAFYTQYGDKLHLDPKASLSGTVSLNENTRQVSGTAEITISNDYEQDQLANPQDVLITISELNFSNISYSDMDDLKKMLKK
jgi:hypothetical protein